jgi:hypothetical protein
MLGADPQSSFLTPNGVVAPRRATTMTDEVLSTHERPTPRRVGRPRLTIRRPRLGGSAPPRRDAPPPGGRLPLARVRARR